jgi:hypothetical protein
MDKKTICGLFADILERTGLKGAIHIIEGHIISLSEKKSISIFEAATEHSNSENEQDTSKYQLYVALTKANPQDLQWLEYEWDKLMLNSPDVLNNFIKENLHNGRSS